MCQNTSYDFLLRINRIVAMVTNQLALHLATECARLIGG